MGLGPGHCRQSAGGLRGSLSKDRSVGSVICYNALQGGAHAIHLVESEDFYQTATADPACRQTRV